MISQLAFRAIPQRPHKITVTIELAAISETPWRKDTTHGKVKKNKKQSTSYQLHSKTPCSESSNFPFNAKYNPELTFMAKEH